MSITTNRLDAVVGRAAADQNIDTREAAAIVRAAKASGANKPIDAVFEAIDRTNASVDAKATRFICANLDQKMSRAEWVRYVQKCASTAGAWGPSGGGTTTVKREQLPPALKKIYDRWLETSPHDKPDVQRFAVAGKPAFLMSQYSEFGTGMGLFDEAGKSIALKEDTKNVERNARRIQGAFDKWFGSPALKTWKDSVQHTELGVIKNFYEAAALLKGKDLAAAMTSEVKRVAGEMKRLLKSGAEVEVYKSKRDGSLLLLGEAKGHVGPEHYALFSKQGRLIERFVIDV